MHNKRAVSVIAFSLLASMTFAAAPTASPAPATRPARSPQPVPSATVPQIQRGTDGRHQSFLEIAKKGDIDLLFIGDSITDFWRRPGPAGGAAVWEKTFAPLKAANFGINADRTQHVLWRLQNGELDGFKAKCIVMMLGTNNLSAGTEIRNTTPEAIDGMKLVINTIREKQPQAKLLLLGIFPRGRTADDPFRPVVKAANAELAKFADGKNIFFMDLSDKFLAPDGTLPMETFPDARALHPNEKGYQIWADAIIGKVKELMAMPG